MKHNKLIILFLAFFLSLYLVNSNVGNLRFTDNTTNVYDQDGIFNINFTEANVSNMVADFIPPFNVTRQISFGNLSGVNYTIFGSKDNGVFTQLAVLKNLTNVTAGVGSIALRQLNLSNSTGLSGNYTFYVRTEVYNITGIHNTTYSNNISLYVDLINPTATITEPIDTRIQIFHNIKYTCSSSDLESGVNSCSFKLTKPGGNTKDLNCNSEQSLIGDDTNEAGDYSLECKVTDRAGRTISKTASFSTYYGATGGASESGGGGGGGGTSEETTEIEEINETQEQKEQQKQEEIQKQQEEVTQQKQREQVIIEEKAKPSYTWLWITLIVIIVILIVWYFLRKK